MNLLLGASAVFALLTVYFIFSMGRHARRRRPVRATRSLAGGAASGALGGASVMLAFSYYGYERLIEEQPVAAIEFTQRGNADFVARLMVDGRIDRQFELRGNEWQLDARIVHLVAAGHTAWPRSDLPARTHQRPLHRSRRRADGGTHRVFAGRRPADRCLARRAALPETAAGRRCLLRQRNLPADGGRRTIRRVVDPQRIDRAPGECGCACRRRGLEQLKLPTLCQAGGCAWRFL